MSRLVSRRSVWALRFPRVSGDEPFQTALDAANVEFSPRERG